MCYSHISSVTNLLFLKVFAHQLNRSFSDNPVVVIKIVWKIADLINKKVVFFFRVLLSQFSVCFLNKLFQTSQLC